MECDGAEAPGRRAPLPLLVRPCASAATESTGSFRTASLPGCTKTLPRLVRSRGGDAEAPPPAAAKPHAAYAWDFPRYTPRTVVPRAHHPLWSALPAGELRIPCERNARAPFSRVPLLLRDECVAREAIVAAERAEALRTLPTWRWALADGVSELSIVEGIRRRVIAEEEEAQVRLIDHCRVFEYRCVAVGTEPLTRVMRNYALRWRGRRARQAAARKGLYSRETESRCDVIADWIASRRRTLCRVTEAMETLFRCEISALQLRTQCVYGATFIRLAERVDVFPYLFGCSMATARVCGRVVGHTLFRQLDLERDYHYTRLLREEEMQREGVLIAQRFEALEEHSEVSARAECEKAEAVERVELQFIICALMYERGRREIEIVEACVRELDVVPLLRGLIGRLGRPTELRGAASGWMSGDTSQHFPPLEVSLHEDAKEE